MTRRRDVLALIMIYVLAVAIYLFLATRGVQLPLSPKQLNAVWVCFLIQSVTLFISSYYVWKANIVKTKKQPEYLLDFPDSMIFLLATPSFIPFIIAFSLVNTSESILSNSLSILISLLPIIGFIFVAPIIVEGIALFLSSKYTKIKTKKER